MRRIMRRRFMNISNSMPLSFEALEDGLSISFSNGILYCINGGAWETLLAGEQTEEVNKGSVISFRHAKSISSYGVGTFSINKKCNAYGACSSIIPKFFGEKYMADYLFARLFNGCDAIVDASKLELPATTLAERCYYYMFNGCTSLVNAPELPATTLAESCYRDMFGDCTSLVNAPALPAMTLARSCYYSMFSGCTSLTTAPELPATTLVTYCYGYMFLDCTKLNYIKMLATDISAENCLTKWVGRVASTGTFVKNPAMTTLPTATEFNDYTGIPSGWTVINDGKIENKISLKKISWEIYAVSEYPVNNDITVEVMDGSTIYSLQILAGTDHSSEGLEPPVNNMGYLINSVTPTEDDYYTYTF